MRKLFEILGYMLMFLGAAMFLSVNLEPPLTGICIVAIFLGSAVALSQSRRIDFKNDQRFSSIFGTVRIGGLTALCLTMLTFGTNEAMRPLFAIAALLLVLLFWVQKIIDGPTER